MSPRFEGSWMIAPSGSGKTTALLHLVNRDIARVPDCSVVVIDSAGDAEGRLMHYLSRHADFAPGGRLHDRLVYLEPDVEHPLALNLFDLGFDFSTMTPNQKREAMVAARDMGRFVISGLLGLELTKKQGGVYRYLVEAMLHIPGASIFTLAELLTDEGYEKLRKHILGLHPWARDFFEQRFRSPTRGVGVQPRKHRYLNTKSEIFDRLDTVLSDDFFRDMFSHPRNKPNLFERLQQGCVVLINADVGRLGEEMLDIYGRFWIAQLAAVGTRRLRVPEHQNKPVYIYIDECHQYLKDELKIVKVLDELARKNKLGFFFAHHRIDQVSCEVLNAFASTSILWASRPRIGADFIAKALQIDDPTTLANLPVGTFASLVRERNTVRKGPVTFPDATQHVRLMADSEFEQVRAKMWEKFCGRPAHQELPDPPPAGSSDPEDPSFEDIEPIEDEEL